VQAAEKLVPTPVPSAEADSKPAIKGLDAGLKASTTRLSICLSFSTLAEAQHYPKPGGV
jgi:hypothetical protein